MRPLLQPGNSVRAVWRARLDEHLGTYAMEGLQLRAASLFASSHSVYGVTDLAALVRLLPERDPHEMIYQMLEATLDQLDDPCGGGRQPREVRTRDAWRARLRPGSFDLRGHGRERGPGFTCRRDPGARSRAAPGEPWRDRLLRLPPFLVADEATMFSAQDLQDGFAITGLFLQRHVLEPRGLTHSDARAGFIAAVMRNGAPGLA